MALVAPSLAAPEKVTISICYHHAGEPWAKIMRETVDRAIAIFKSKMKELGLDVDVKVIELPITVDEDYKAKLVLDIKAGRAADIIFVDSFWVPEFVEAGYLLPLPVQDWTGWGKFYPAMRGMVTYKGKAYALMFDTDVRLIYYNKVLFKKVGLPEDWRPRSWSDIIEAARIIKKKLPDVTPIQFYAITAQGEATSMQSFYMWLLGALPKEAVTSGNWLYDFKRGKWVIYKSAWLDTLKIYKLVFVDEKLGDISIQLEKGGTAWQPLQSGVRDRKVAMLIDGSWVVCGWSPIGVFPWPARDKELGWAPMPGSGKPDTMKIVCVSGGWTYAINAFTKHPLLAWEFLKVLGSADVISYWCSVSVHIPTREDATLNPKLFPKDPSAVKLNDEMAKAIMPYTTYRPARPEYPKVSTLIQQLVEKVATGAAGPEAALDSFVAQLKKLVGPENVEVLP